MCFALTSCLLCPIKPPRLMFVMSVSRIRVINYLFHALIVCSRLRWSLFFEMSGDQPPSFRNNNYYIYFLDDYSKFTWIYLLKHKSEVFQKFQDFQAHVERLFNHKCSSCKLTGVVNTTNSVHPLIVLALHINKM
jgi:hypothetical protein